jgi:hypothetical protein
MEIRPLVPPSITFPPNNTIANTGSRRRDTHVELYWAFEKEANRTRIARNTFPKTSVPFLPKLNGAK